MKKSQLAGLAHTFIVTVPLKVSTNRTLSFDQASTAAMNEAARKRLWHTSVPRLNRLRVSPGFSVFRFSARLRDGRFGLIRNFRGLFGSGGELDQTAQSPQRRRRKSALWRSVSPTGVVGRPNFSRQQRQRAARPPATHGQLGGIDRRASACSRPHEPPKT